MLYISMKTAVIMILWTENGNYDWSKYSIPLIHKYLSSEKLVIVDNNKNPDELEFVRKYTSIILPGDRSNSHGQGIDIAVQWCRENDIDILVHIEPDCTLTSRLWFDSLVQPIVNGDAWMTGGVRMGQGYIHICPTAWLVSEIKHTFGMVARRDDIYRPAYQKLIDVKDLVRNIDADAVDPHVIWFFLYIWDTGIKNWFDIAAQGKAKLVPIPGITHHWLGRRGSPKNLLFL